MESTYQKYFSRANSDIIVSVLALTILDVCKLMITLVLVLVLVLRIINLYFYRTSSQQIVVPSGPFLVSRTGAMGSAERRSQLQLLLQE